MPGKLGFPTTLRSKPGAPACLCVYSLDTSPAVMSVRKAEPWHNLLCLQAA